MFALNAHFFVFFVVLCVSSCWWGSLPISVFAVFRRVGIVTAAGFDARLDGGGRTCAEPPRA